MPNNITNILTVEGAQEDVASFFSAVDGGLNEQCELLLIDFNKIKPMPESLNVECSDRGNTALDCYVIKLSEQSGSAAVKAALGDYAGAVFRRLPETLSSRRTGKYDTAELPKLGERLFNNIRAYGAPTWYEWRNENWGTKWPAYNQKRLDDNTITFYTAWAGVPDLLRELSARFPGIEMFYGFADENFGNNVGEYRFEGGEINYEFTPENGSPGALRIAEEILSRSYPEEETAPVEDENDREQGDDDL
jgi:hypothetical protein